MNISKLWYNERDVESSKLVDFMQRHSSIVTLLDVGCHASYSYAGKIRKQLPRMSDLKRYYGIDIIYDDVIDAVVDEYILDNVNTANIDFVPEAVVCISSLEHSGITTYTVPDYKEEQVRTFNTVYGLAYNFLFVSVPYGKEGIVPGQYANITSTQLDRFISDKKNISIEFWYNPDPIHGGDWKQISREEADKVELQPDTVTRCVCFIEATK